MQLGRAGPYAVIFGHVERLLQRDFVPWPFKLLSGKITSLFVGQKGFSMKAPKGKHIYPDWQVVGLCQNGCSSPLQRAQACFGKEFS